MIPNEFLFGLNEIHTSIKKRWTTPPTFHSSCNLNANILVVFCFCLVVCSNRKIKTYLRKAVYRLLPHFLMRNEMMNGKIRLLINFRNEKERSAHDLHSEMFRF